MEEFKGRVAVVTGAASGIGYALAERFLAEGMRVVLADVETPALERATARLDPEGAHTRAVPTDVSVWEDVSALADAAYEAFGAVHIVCNNAGVAGTRLRAGGIWDRDLEDWQWLLGVNLWGVIHGTHAFVPRMLAGGQEGHVVNTASLAGIMYANSIYSVSKHAVVALSEAVRAQLAVANAPVGISVLCPGVVDTNILDADRNRPPALRVDAPPPTEEMRAADEEARRNLERGLAPSSIAAAVVDGIREGRFFIIPVQDEIRDGVRSAVRRRADSIVKALGR